MNLTCNYCHSPAKYRCGRCKVEGYCTQKCQSNDFPSHRFVCFNMPVLMPVNGPIALDTHRLDDSILSLANLQMADVEVNEPPVKLSKPDPVNKPQQNLTNIHKVPEKEKEAPKALTVETVEKPKEKKLPVKEVVEPPKIPLAVSKEITQPKPAPVPAVPPQKEDRPIQKVDPPLKTPAFNQGPRTIPPVELNKPMLKKGPVIPDAPGEDAEKSDESPPVQKRVYYSEIKKRRLPVGKHQVAIMNYDPDTNMLYVLETFDPAIQEFVTWIDGTIKEMASADKTASYTPEPEEMVLAKFEGDYYRGVHTGKTKGKLYEIQFVDYGNVSFCPTTDIKPFSHNLLMDIILHKVVAENMPNPMTKKAMTILSGENPVELEVTGKLDADVYACKIIGL